MQRAFDEASRTVKADPHLPDARSTLGSILLARRDFDGALVEGHKAIELGPSDAEVHAVLAQTQMATAQWERAIDLSRKAIQLSPRHPSWHWVPQVYGLIYLGRYDDAIIAGRRMAAVAESPFMCRSALCAIAFALVEAGRVEEARHCAEEIQTLGPWPGSAASRTTLLFQDLRHGDRFVEALRKAGLPG